jgi:signal transduction histidine kinase
LSVTRSVGAVTYHERGLAELIANTRIVFALGNFPILYLDWLADHNRTRESLFALGGVGALFLAYALLSRWLLWTGTVSLARFQLWSPIGDVTAASGLILITGGYTSPFYLWLLFAVVATGFSPYALLPLFMASVVVTIQAAIATIPQTEPLSAAATAARMVYTLGFGMLTAGIGGYLRRQARALAAIEEIGRQIGDAQSEGQAIELLPQVLADHLKNSRVLLRVAGREPAEAGVCKKPNYSLDRDVKSGDDHIGIVSAYRQTPFAWQDSYFLSVMCDRFATTVRRLRLAQQLVELATRHERLRFADDLHDKYLQTLAAVDLHAEAARLLNSGQEPLASEITTIKQIVRDGAKRARSFIEEQEPSEPGAKAVREVLAQRWSGDHTVAIDRRVDLDRTQWQCVEFLLKEGLNNARRHGKASKVNLTIEQKNGQVRVSLEADGRSPSRDAMFGYGLGRVAQMAEQCSGSVSLVGSESGGSALLAVFKAAQNR